MNFTDLQKGFWWKGSIAFFVIYILAMILLMIAKLTGIVYMGVAIALIWLISGLIIPVFIQFFAYQNFRPFWVSLLWALGSGVIVLAINAVFILVNGCNSTVDGCVAPFKYAIVYMSTMLVLIFISTVVVSIKDWRARFLQSQVQQPPKKVQPQPGPESTNEPVQQQNNQ